MDRKRGKTLVAIKILGELKVVEVIFNTVSDFKMGGKTKPPFPWISFHQSPFDFFEVGERVVECVQEIL